MFNPIEQPPQRFGANPKRWDGDAGKSWASERAIFAVIESDN